MSLSLNRVRNSQKKVKAGSATETSNGASVAGSILGRARSVRKATKQAAKHNAADKSDDGSVGGRSHLSLSLNRAERSRSKTKSIALPFSQKSKSKPDSRASTPATDDDSVVSSLDGGPPAHIEPRFDHYQLILGDGSACAMVRLPRGSEHAFADVRREIECDVDDLPFPTFKFVIGVGGAAVSRRQEGVWRVKDYRGVEDDGDGSAGRPHRVYVREDWGYWADDGGGGTRDRDPLVVVEETSFATSAASEDCCSVECSFQESSFGSEVGWDATASTFSTAKGPTIPTR